MASVTLEVMPNRSMNYRRGFQRVYAVCAFLWVAGILALAIHIAGRMVPPPRTLTDAEIAARTAARTLTDADIDRLIAGRMVQPEVLTDADIDALDKRGAFSSYKGDAPEDSSTLRIVKSEPLPGAARSHWIVYSAIGILPPVLLYLFLFAVLPWIYRGFRPSNA
jgi:hypothetical protein